MFDPLKIAYNRSLLIQLKLSHQKETFRCTHYTRADQNTPVARYTLRQIQNNTTVILEVTKDTKNNFHIKAFQMIEERPFSARFVMMLGTDAIAFAPAKQSAKKRILYDRIPHPDEKTDIIKYICDPEELPLHPDNLGYTRDGNGNWYQLLEQSQGRLRHFTDKTTIRSWEYTDENYTRLLIEREETEGKRKEDFYIYLGKCINRAQINLIQSRSELPAMTCRSNTVTA